MVLSDLSIKRPVFAWMLMLGLIGFGAVSFFRLGISQLPDVDFPVVTVSLHEDGATPQTMEQDVVDIIEDQMMSIQGVRQVRSVSSVARATVTVEFDLSRNIDLAAQDVQLKLSAAQKLLPTELDPPALTKTNPDDFPIVYVALQAEGYKPTEIMRYARDTLKNKFAGIPGVGDIQIGGYLDPALRIWVRDDMLDKYYIAANDIVTTLQNEQVDPPTGQVSQGLKEYNVRFYGEAGTPEDFAKIPIDRSGGQDAQWRPPRLGDVARIEEGILDVTTMARTLGKPSVSFGLIKQRGSNAVAVARAVKARLLEVDKQLPKGMKLQMVFDSTTFIEESVSELTFTLGLSALLTGLVCWLFLGSWSSTINVLFAIPTSIIGAFSVIYFMGFTLNTFTLMALSLAIGIVVDDAIMVLENIIRHQEMGKGPVRAALEGAREITFAATAASISVIAIFLPVAFMTGIIGKFFYQFGVVMSATVAISLVEALTLTPMRAAVIKGSHEQKEPGPIRRFVDGSLDKLTHAYGATLRTALGMRWLVVAISIVVAVLSFWSARFLRSEFLPPEDQSRFLLRLTTPVGSSLAYTDARMKIIEAFFASRPEVEVYTAFMGTTTQGGDLNSGTSFVTLKEPGVRPKDKATGKRLNQFEFMELARKDLAPKMPESRVVMQDLSMRGLTTSRGFPVEFTILGNDWDALGAVAKKMMAEMKASGQMVNIDTDYRDGIPEIQVRPDRDRASERGAVLSSVGAVINSMIGGQKVTQYSRFGHRYDVRVKLEGVEDTDIYESLKRLKIRNSANNLIPLTSLVKIETKPTAQSISRQDRVRAITIYSGVAPGGSQQQALDEVQKIATKVLPPGYRITLSGSSEQFKQSFESLIVALVLGLFVAYMILATQFNSFIDPVSVLVALPFSMTGAFVSLLVTGQSVNIYSMIGFILLMGIAKKNSILLVEFTNEVRGHNEGMSVKDALVHACPIRLRPILMTSIATVAGAVPQALSIGPGAETRMPMAIALIGGVTISTFFTLYFVPCVYDILSRFESRESLMDREARLEQEAQANGVAAKAPEPGPAAPEPMAAETDPTKQEPETPRPSPKAEPRPREDRRPEEML